MRLRPSIRPPLEALSLYHFIPLFSQFRLHYLHTRCPSHCIYIRSRPLPARMTTSIATITTRESVFVRLIHEMSFVRSFYRYSTHPSHVNIRPYTECLGLHPSTPTPIPTISTPVSLPLPRPPNNVLCRLSHPPCLSPALCIVMLVSFHLYMYLDVVPAAATVASSASRAALVHPCSHIAISHTFRDP